MNKQYSILRKDWQENNRLHNRRYCKENWGKEKKERKPQLNEKNLELNLNRN
jgi:hypothetical protein